MMNYPPAQLDESKLGEIQKLEAELGKTIVALNTDPGYASMNPEDIQKLRDAETKLGVVLVAYEN